MDDQFTPEREFTGVFIPAAIWNRDDLSWVEKCLLAEIGALGGHRGECWASNAHLAGKMQLSEERVRKVIGHLHAIGLLKTVKFDGATRWMATTYDSGWSKTTRQGGRKRPGRLVENDHQDTQKRYTEEKDTPSASAPAVSTGHAGHVIFRFWQAYAAAFKAQFGTDYAPTHRARDMAEARRMIKAGITAERFVDRARWVWANGTQFEKSRAATMNGLANIWNEISTRRAESAPVRTTVRLDTLQEPV